MIANQLFNRISLFFYKNTTLWLVGLFLILIVLMLISLPLFENILQIEENMISLDAPQIYSSDRVYEILTEWGEMYILSWIKAGLTLTKYHIFGPAILFRLAVSTFFAIKNRFIIQD